MRELDVSAARASHPSPATGRRALAVGLARLATRISQRVLDRDGSVIGGEVALRIDPALLSHLSRQRVVALVSGTNGKTTATALLTALGRDHGVVSNTTGANLPNGLVAVLLTAASHATAVLEVDEAVLPSVVAATDARLVVLLNLSRDQLDRVHEVRRTAAAWRSALAKAPTTHVVANADDPLVVFAAENSPVTWVAAGQPWRKDAATCAHCGGTIVFDASWVCTGCGWARPALDYRLEGDDLLKRSGERFQLALDLPGRCNNSNAALAVAASHYLGFDADPVSAWAGLTEISGRYQVVHRDGTAYRLLLAKNPAGWAEMLNLLDETDVPVVLALNARVQDGLDPSWIWDVPFERLRGRHVVCAGARASDLAVRLAFAGVTHHYAADLREALGSVNDRQQVDVVANYSAFQETRRLLKATRAH